MGRKRSSFHKISLCTECAVNLICRNLKILFALFPRLCFCVIPSLFCSLEQIYSTHYVCLNKDFGIGNTSVDVRFCRKINHIVKIIFFKQSCNKLLVADISLHKHMTSVALHALEVFQITCVGQLIQIDQQDIVIFLQHVINKIGTDKTGATGNQIFFHIVFPS